MVGRDCITTYVIAGEWFKVIVHNSSNLIIK